MPQSKPISYKFDDSKDTHRIGIKKNKFSHHRSGDKTPPEFDVSSGWPEGGYEKGHERIEKDNPSHEGEPWFVSYSFNDPITNKRPLHPTKDYYNPNDPETGDDHLEMGKGNLHHTTKVDFKSNNNVDSDNYDIEGKLKVADKGAQHLVNKNLNEQLNRIKHLYFYTR